MPTPYTIRPAHPHDLDLLPAIASAAGAMFHDSPYPEIADDTMPTIEINPSHEFVWVIVDATDQPVGFAIVQIHDDFVYLKELDVHPDHGRQGLGSRLIQELAAWARAQGYSALTLTTFADVPWNGPYYARLGFRTLDIATLSPAMQAVWNAESQSTTLGTLMQHRICMQLDL